MPARNTQTSYGFVAKSFHWLTALLILSLIPLGIIANDLPFDTGEALARKAFLFSMHKTLGVTLFFVALARIAWALGQPKPAGLHPERRAESFLAELVHWLLYGSLIVVPLSGWVHHASTSGFAPIWWPFGQDLPFVPKSEPLAELAATVHWAAGMVLALSVAAHIGGALKHAVRDRDGTLARMVSGAEAGDPRALHSRALPALVAALVVWVAVIGASLTVFAPRHVGAVFQAGTAGAGEWAVQEGTLSFTITQLGAQVTGSFGGWQAEITYDPATGTGQLRTEIDTTTVALGSVTDQAKGPEFFDVTRHERAVFEAEIARVDEVSHTATGTLTLVGQSLPVTLTFDLEIEDGMAQVVGRTTLDRRDFGMGPSYPDESGVGFAVDVALKLTAQRGE